MIYYLIGRDHARWGRVLGRESELSPLCDKGPRATALIRDMLTHCFTSSSQHNKPAMGVGTQEAPRSLHICNPIYYCCVSRGRLLSDTMSVAARLRYPKPHWLCLVCELRVPQPKANLRTLNQGERRIIGSWHGMQFLFTVQH